MKKNNDYHKTLISYTDLEGNGAIESIHAKEEGLYCRIKNIPFNADSIALDDLVEVKTDEDGLLYFSELIKAFGNNTIQIIFFVKDAML